MKKLSILFFAIVLASFQMTAQSSKNYNLDEFNAITISNSANVIYSQGAQSVSVSGSQDLIDKLEVYVEKGMLKITSKRGASGNWYGKEGLKFKISSPELSRLIISGSGDFYTEGDINAKKIALTISGSGDVEIGGNVSCTEFILLVSGSGDVKAKGNSQRLQVTCSGSGDVEMDGFKSKEASVVNSGSADIEIYTSEKLSVVNSGSGDVEVKGSPEKKSIINTGSGDIDYK